MEKPKPRTMPLPVELSNESILVRAREMGAKTREKAEKQDELRSHQEAAKGRTKTLESDVDKLDYEIARLGTIVRTGREDRDVEVVDEIDAKAGQVNTVRLDTGEIVGTRGMTEAERQRSLFDEKNKGPKKTEATAGA